jgi:integrase
MANKYKKRPDGRYRAVKTIDLQHLINAKAEAGLTRTVDQIVIALRQIFDEAVENDLLYKSPARKLKADQYVAPPKRAMYDYEKTAMDKAEISPKKRAFLSIGRYAGLRRGKILALTKSDFDLKENTLTVSKTLVFKEKGPSEIKHIPKSQAGYRTIPMPTVLANFIADYLKSPKECIFL